MSLFDNLHEHYKFLKWHIKNYIFKSHANKIIHTHEYIFFNRMAKTHIMINIKLNSISFLKFKFNNKQNKNKM